MNSSPSLLAPVAPRKIPFPACLVSGGQTGADRAALDFAIAQNLLHAGYCAAAAADLKQFLTVYSPRVLNVAGSAES